MESRKSIISEGVLVAASSVLAYLLTFVYERGFCAVFGIPSEFIAPTLTSIFLTACALIPALIVLYSLADFIYVILPKRMRGGPEYWRMIYLVIFGFIAWLEGYFTVKIFPIFFIMIVFFDFGFPLITQRSHKGYRAKLEAQDKIDNEETLLGLIMQPLGAGWRLFLVFILILTLLTYSLGRKNAINQKDFLVINTLSQPYAVLRIYGDKLICASFNRETKEIQGSFLIFEISKSNLVLTVESIGPLRTRKIGK